MILNTRLVTLLMIIVVGSTVISQYSMTSKVYASGGSPYNSGYDHGCDDAGRSESDKYINEPEKGPSFHTQEFINGYYDGLNNCSGGGERDDDDDEPESEPPRTGGINWENLCNQYGSLVGIKEPCSEYADGTQLTEKGRTALVCLLGGGGISVLPGLDPATKAAILELGRQYCP